MPSLMFVRPAVLEKLRQADRIALFALNVCTEKRCKFCKEFQAFADVELEIL